MSDSPTPAQPQSFYLSLEEPDLLPPLEEWPGQDEPKEEAASGTRARDASAAPPPAGRNGCERILATRSGAPTSFAAAGSERRAPAAPPEDVSIDPEPELRQPRGPRLRPLLALSGLLAAPAFAGLALAAVGLPQFSAISARKPAPATAHASAQPSAAPGAEPRVSGNGAPVFAQGNGDALPLAADRPFEKSPRASGSLLLASDEVDRHRSLSTPPVRGLPNMPPSVEGVEAGPASGAAGSGGETLGPPQGVDTPAAAGSGDTGLADEPAAASALSDRRPYEATGNEVPALADEEAPAFASDAPEPQHPEVAGGTPPLPGADRAPDLLEAGERAAVGPAPAHDSARPSGEPESALAEPVVPDRPSGAEAAGGAPSPSPATSDAPGTAAVPAVVSEQATTLDTAADQAHVPPLVDEALNDGPPPERPAHVELPDTSAFDTAPTTATSALPAVPSSSVRAEEVPLPEAGPDAAPRLSLDGAADRSGATPDTGTAMRDESPVPPAARVAVPRPAMAEPGGEAPAREDGAGRRGPAPTPAPAPAPAPSALVEALVSRGDAMVARRDISAARLLYERAAAAGSARAAAALARTHDPEFLAGIGAPGIQGDAALAKAWREKAASLSDPAPAPAPAPTPRPAPAPASVPAPEPAPAPSALVEALVSRGDAMVARRDISAARLLYERAAAAGSARAAAALARTHDPEFLAGIGAPGIQGDAALAKAWYQKAAALGDGRALARAEALRGPEQPPQRRP